MRLAHSISTLLLAGVLWVSVVPPAKALERGIVYSKTLYPLSPNASGEYGPTVGGLYTLHGERPQRVTHDPADVEPNVSRSGLIAFVRDGDIYLVRRDGTGLRQLTGGPELDERPLFAPDGRSLVFSRRSVAKGPRDLYLVRLDGSPSLALAATSADESEAAFSLGGAEIAFVSAGDLYATKPSGGAPRRLTRTPEAESTPHYFVGGIVFNRSHTSLVVTPGIYRMRRDGSRVETVYVKKVGTKIRGVTPDGRRLAFTSAGDYWSKKLVGRKALAPRRLSGVYGTGDLAISPDGRHGAFLLYFDEDFAIQVVNLIAGGFGLSADLYSDGGGTEIDPRLAW